MRPVRMAMRPARMLVGILLVLVPLSGCAEVRQGTQAKPWVEVSPGTVKPGDRVAVRANCVDNSKPATVRSTAFGNVSVEPSDRFLQAETKVPKNTKAGKYEVTLSCPSGEEAKTDITVVAPSATSTPSGPSGSPPPTKGPGTGGGYLENGNGGAE